MWTYSAALVARWLEARAQVEAGLPRPAPQSSHLGCRDCPLHEHGLALDFAAPPGFGQAARLRLSVQTHPAVVGDAFAETCVLRVPARPGALLGGVASSRALGYACETRRHATPEALFAHLREVADALRGAGAYAAVLGADPADAWDAHE